MSTFLFDDFEGLTPAAWKQKIQMDLKGADYNETLLWKTDEGIVVRPFYTEEDRNYADISLPKKGFNICQSIFVDDVSIANKLAVDALNRGANSIRFSATETFDANALLENIDTATTLYFNLNFLDADFMLALDKASQSFTRFFQVDILGNLARTGNWFSSLKDDINTVNNFSQLGHHLSVDATLYQNAGANIAQQLAYALAHTNEYLEIFDEDIANKIHYQFAVGSNYFFEIAKLRAFRILRESLLKERSIKVNAAHIFTQPSLRNKTLYDYNVNMLRTTSESMSAILGGSDTISNVAYDAIYHKSNEFGERIARNQLLILQKEAYLHEAQSFANGSYYIESITKQLAEKALIIFKQIEKGGGFLQQLKAGNIQKKVNESAEKELQLFNQEKVVLLGTNKQANNNDRMKDNLELYPFVKKRISKTLIPPSFQQGSQSKKNNNGWKRNNMTGNSKEIKKLKYQQAKKKQLITKYKKRVKKHLILLVLPFIAYIAYYIDNAYSTYGSVSKFLTIVALVLGVLILLYLIAVRFMIRQREQEIKVIRGKLYHLMKLNDE